MMKKKKLLALLLASAMVCTLALAGCNSGSGGTTGETPGTTGTTTSTSSGRVIKIGFVNPTSGVLSGFGKGSPWVEQHVVDIINDAGGIYIEEYGENLQVQLIMYDCQSDSAKAGELTQKLIEEDKVDIVLARHTPEIVNPVVQVCERFGVPCVSTDAPVDAVLAEGPYTWSYHSHWDLETIYNCYQAMWTDAGYAPGSGAKVGLFLANDADGTSWNSYFTQKIVENGYTLVDPGMFPANTQDFSDIINQFKAQGVQILAGTATNSDFSTLWRQAKQQGFAPEMVVMGKAFLLKSDALAIGADLMDGLCCEVWWSPTHPWQSALTGETPQDIADIYLAEKGEEITTPMGAKYYGVEIALDALQRCQTLDKEKIREAIGETDLDTIFGHVQYREDHMNLTSLTGGQWVKTEDGDLERLIIDNTLFPNIPTTGTLKPLNQ